jgi:hypothetical protein
VAETRTIQKYTADKATDWMEWSGIALADVVYEDETPSAAADQANRRSPWFVQAPGFFSLRKRTAAASVGYMARLLAVVDETKPIFCKNGRNRKKTKWNDSKCPA